MTYDLGTLRYSSHGREVRLSERGLSGRDAIVTQELPVPLAWLWARYMNCARWASGMNRRGRWHR